jgi:hypothetical protein
MVLQKPNIGQQYKLFRYKSGHIRPLKDKKVSYLSATRQWSRSESIRCPGNLTPNFLKPS